MTMLIADTHALGSLCERVAKAPRVALDTEFHNERSYAARLMVVQLGFEDEVVIVDPLALPDLAPLALALSETTVVGHALSSDLRIFAERFGFLPHAAFDTQVAASFCGFGNAISLLDLVQAVTGIRLRKSQTVSDWSLRPFSERQLEYLIDDVAHLFTLQDHLQQRLDKTGRSAWAVEEMATLVDLQAYTSDPERLYLRLPGALRMGRRDLAVLREIAVLRDRLARERDVPAKYIFPDDVVTGLASLRPVALDELSQLRRLDASVRKNFGDQIIQAIAAASALPDDALPPKPVRHAPLQRDALVSLMSVLTSSIAAANDLPAALLASRASLERVARDLPKDRIELAVALELNPWRIELLAEPMLALLRGEVALRVEGTRNGSPRVVVSTVARGDKGEAVTR